MDRVELDEEDTKAVVSQLTSYDNFLRQFSEVDAQLNRYYAVVMVPPKAPDTREKWVAVTHAGGGDWAFYPTVREPDPERKAICSNIYGGENDCCFYHCYWYADELSRCMVLAVVFAVVLSILTTPLVLLCFVPMIHKMRKVGTHILIAVDQRHCIVGGSGGEGHFEFWGTSARIRHSIKLITS